MSFKENRGHNVHSLQHLAPSLANPFMDGLNTAHVGVDSDAVRLDSF